MGLHWENQQIMIVGMGKSGLAAALLLAQLGAIPMIVDQKSQEHFTKEMEILSPYPVQWYLGENPENLLDKVEKIVISPGVPIQAPFIVRAKEKNISVIGEMELGYQIAQGEMIAITGTNGKTTTTTLVGEILKNAGRLTHVVGNIGHPYSAIALKSKKTDSIVAEVSSFQLESIESFHPKIAAVLNITPDHLDRHGTMENYIALKKR
ncbi:MAG: UDP-N-acetylmuramoyl-L-alanine--D-glutamate ligase, partial [Clostridiales bacterium]|nr:UDP-N-acetylmuramoyl-L-alanine--D-glutamate ligase [Clostridiales bacterium]